MLGRVVAGVRHVILHGMNEWKAQGKIECEVTKDT